MKLVQMLQDKLLWAGNTVLTVLSWLYGPDSVTVLSMFPASVHPCSCFIEED